MVTNDLTSVDFMLPESMKKSLIKLSEERHIDIDVLARLAIFDFLVKFNNYKGDTSERERYQSLYDHFALNPAEKQIERARAEVAAYSVI